MKITVGPTNNVVFQPATDRGTSAKISIGSGGEGGAGTVLAYNQANAARGQANTAYGQANAAYGQANAAYTAANNAKVTVFANNASNVTTQNINFVNTSTITVEVSSSGTNANIGFTAVGGAAYDQANAARDQANTAYGQANNSRTQANSARDQANTARTQANNAYDAANNRVLKTGDTMTGTLNINYSGVGLNVNSQAIFGNTVTVGNSNTGLFFQDDVNGFATIELGGPQGGYIDFKMPVDEDYDFRIYSTHAQTEFISARTDHEVAFMGANVSFNTNVLSIDVINNRVGLGTNTPCANLEVVGTAYIPTLNASVVNSTSFITSAGLNVTDQANTARNTANAAYDAANNRVLKSGDTMTGILNVASTIISQNIIPNLNVTYDLGNTTNRFNDLYLGGNSVYIGDAVLSTNGDTVLTNTFVAELSFISGGLNVLNQANSAYDKANAATTDAQNAYAQANAGYGQANTARDQANTARTTANDAYNTANTKVSKSGDTMTGDLTINTVLYANQANITTTLNVGTSIVTGGATGDISGANAIFAGSFFTNDGLNVAAVGINSYSQANSARDQANNAYAEANLKLNLTGGTINGSLNVSGNLTITGNTSYINVTTLNVTDPLIFLASNNDTSDVVDIGFVGAKKTGATVTHTGLARDAGDGTYYLFDNLVDSGHENNVIDFANSTLAILRANIAANSITLVGETVATHANLILAYTQANNARDQANSARNQANTARTTANDAYGAANSSQTNALNAYGQANNARDQANTARTTANNAYDQANNARNQANTAYGQANNARDQANTARTTANNAYDQANNARNQANTAYGQANDAYGQANTARTTANDAYGQANTARDQANTARTQANNSYAAANSAANTARVSANSGSTLSAKQLNFNNTASITVTVESAGDGTNANISFATTGAAVGDAYNQANSARDQANTARGQANTARDTANAAYAQANSNYISAEIEYKVYAVIAGVSAYGYVFQTNDGKVISQWNYADGVGQLNPSLYLRPGTTVAFKLMDDLDPGVGWNSQPFNIYDSDGSTLLTEALTHVATNGTVTTGSAAQGKTSGTLYFTIPQNRKNTTYVYNTSDFSGFNYFGGDFLVDYYAHQAQTTGTNAYDQANTARGQANTARDQANTARTTANDAYGAANSAANTARVSANSGSTLSAKQLNFNNSGSILVTIESAGDGTNANISFVTAGASAADAYNQANTARDQANTARDQSNTARGQANTARDTANAAYAQANSNYISAEIEYKVYAGSPSSGAPTFTTYYGYQFKTNDGKNIVQWNGSDASFVVNPNLFLRPGTTVAFKLMDGLDPPDTYPTQPFNIYDSDGTTQLTEGLTHVSTDGTVTTGITAQNRSEGTLYFTIPQNRTNTVYYYKSGAGHGGTLYQGQFTVDRYSDRVQAFAETVYDQANTARGQANTARNQANTAYGQANDAYGQANTARNQANTAYGQANTARNTANSAYGQANDAYGQANTARNTANSAYGQANNAYDKANSATVRITANTGSSVTTPNINFINTSTVTVSVVSGDSGNANVSFTSSGSQQYTYDTTTTSAETVDSWSATTYRSGKYQMQIENAFGFAALDITLLHDGATTNLIKFGESTFGGSVGTFSSDINSGLVRLRFTATDPTSALTYYRSLLTARGAESLPTDLMTGTVTYDLMLNIPLSPTDLNA